MSANASILFIYNGMQTIIQCMKSDIMRNIFEKFSIKVELEKNKNFYYLYNGIKINEELKYEEIINEMDKKKNQMKILVIEENNKVIRSENLQEINEIICPECRENILLNIEDYRINIYNCKNNHNKNKIDNIPIFELNNRTRIDISKIECNICKENNKGNTYNNEFYKCLTCNKNICPLCKIKHDKSHIIIDYDKRNIICNIHNDMYTKYCKECNKNICYKCKDNHKSHEKIDYEDIIKNNENNKELKDYIDKLENIIDDIVNKLKNIKENMRIYYNLSNNIINNNNRNYEILNNINEFINNNNKIILDIKK